MANFIHVTAKQCNSQGIIHAQSMAIHLELNIDLIGAIRNGEVYLKGGSAIVLNGNYYTEFRIDLNSKKPVTI